MNLDDLAAQCGASLQRLYDGRFQVTFDPDAWGRFVASVRPNSVDQSLLTDDDPCPGCRPGGFCRTPSCGRLTKINLARINKIDQTLQHAIDSWRKEEGLS